MPPLSPASQPPPQQQQQQQSCVSTVQQQQQHAAFLLSDAAQLQQKVLSEVSKFEEHILLLRDFLLHFADEFADAQQQRHGEFKYRNYLQEIADQRRDDLPIHLEDVAKYFGSSSSSGEKGKGFGVYEGLLVNTCRYMELLHAAADLLLQDTDLFAAAAAAEEAAAADPAALAAALESPAAADHLLRSAALRAKKFDPWRRIRARDMAARGVPAHLRHTL
ncbi:hypothetical protein, conserved [Eimeria tenella]|uniref:Uncharacterized protein n=1 Tax=Eimeria tenella TaxID=5802 RepID=U6KYH0_EIMTE|nr:hypothetical protein, conserved [Eimeria tenella]CDJ43227.1 hypothetical protein, conserved [Eimeria tenella]|eukprot:XP_013233977.1 hypothetical protein, conserved [Eimeria tenella]